MTSRLDKTAEHLRDEEIGIVDYAIRQICLATDGSATAIEATKVAIGMAKLHGAAIVAVMVQAGHVVDPIEEQMIEQSEGVHHSEVGLQVAQRFAEANGVVVKSVIAEGATAHAILEVAADEKCDLIVIGNTGRRGVQRMVLGSVAEAVVREASVPVLVVKHCSTEFCMEARTDS